MIRRDLEEEVIRAEVEGDSSNNSRLDCRNKVLDRSMRAGNKLEVVGLVLVRREPLVKQEIALEMHRIGTYRQCVSIVVELDI